jgi:hypothetical protein
VPPILWAHNARDNNYPHEAEQVAMANHQLVIPAQPPALAV